MENTSLSEQLARIYNVFYPEFQGLRKNFSNFNMANPYLLSLPDGYAMALLRVMLIGKETNHWGTELANVSVETLMELYRKFVIEGWGDNYAFWTFVSALREYSRDDLGNAVSVISNNVVKVGNDGIGFNDELLEAMLKKENLLKEEIGILRPDILIFLTGPSYDPVIKKILGDFAIESIDPALRLDRLYIDGLDVEAYRCYHPRYLSCRRKWNPALGLFKDLFVRKIDEKNRQ